MNIVRYRHYPQSDLSAALDRLANMRAEMDRVFESTFGTFSRSPAPLSRWNAAVDVYQDKDQFTVVVELPWSEEGRDRDLAARRHAYHLG